MLLSSYSISLEIYEFRCGNLAEKHKLQAAFRKGRRFFQAYFFVAVVSIALLYSLGEMP